MKHWTGANSWEEGIRLMANEPTTDPVIAEMEEQMLELTLKMYAHMAGYQRETYDYLNPLKNK